MEGANEASEAKEAGVLPTIKMYQDIVDRAHAEVEAVRKMYYWLSGVIGLILSVGIGSGTFLTYKSFHDMRVDMKEEVEIMKKRAMQDYTMLASDLKSTVESKSQNVERAVNSRIDAEFNKDNIKGLVTSKAQEHIDIVADNYIDKHINNKITPKIKKVNDDIRKIELDVEFNAVSSAAKNDDTKAFQKLLAWSNDKSYPFKDQANQIVGEIKSTKNTILSLPMTYDPPNNIKTNSVSSHIKQVYKEYNETVLPGLRVNIVEYVYGSADISKTDKLNFIHDVIKIDNNLDVVLHATTIFNKLTGQNVDPYNINLVLGWFSKNPQR